MRSHITSVLKPIAQREISSGAHPFEALKAVAETHRTEATAVAMRLGEIFSSMKTFLADVYLKSPLEGRRSDLRSKDGFIHGSVAEWKAFLSTVEDIRELKKILAESSAIQTIPELRHLEETLRPISIMIKLGHQERTPNDAAAYLEQSYNEFRESATQTIFYITNGITDALHVLPQPTSQQLSHILGEMGTCSDVEDAVMPQEKLYKCLKDCRNKIPLDDPSRTTLDDLVTTSMRLLTITKQAVTNGHFRNSANRQLRGLFKEIVGICAENIDTILTFNEKLREPFIEATVKSAITPHLDPTPKTPMTYNITKRLPESLRAPAKGLGVSVNGDLVAISEEGNPAAFADALATLLENNDPSIFRGKKLRGNLAPVVRAALGEARSELKRRDAEEELRLQQAREALEYVKEFFSSDLKDSLPRDPATEQELLKSFVAKYTDIDQIDLRTSAIRAVVKSLPIPEGELTKHFSLYLLTDKEFEIWSRQTSTLKQLVLKNLPGTEGLILNDSSSYLPNTLPQMIEVLQEKTTSATSKD